MLASISHQNSSLIVTGWLPTEISSKVCLACNPSLRTTQKTQLFYWYSSVFAAETCLRRRYVATAAARATENTASNRSLLLHVDSLPWEPSNLVTGLHATVLSVALATS
jgi:hypothetical protein